jgi:ketosteroid isomerase-like protein
VSAPHEPTAAELAWAYIEALQAKDRDRILSLLTEDFALEVPLNCSGSNDLSDSWCGLEAGRNNYDQAFQAIELLKYVDIEITPGKDDRVAFLEGLGRMRMANGRPYANRYVFRFDAEGGKIRRIREYTNPVTAAVSFGMPLPQPKADADVSFVTATPA